MLALSGGTAGGFSFFNTDIKLSFLPKVVISAEPSVKIIQCWSIFQEWHAKVDEFNSLYSLFLNIELDSDPELKANSAVVVVSDACSHSVVSFQREKRNHGS